MKQAIALIGAPSSAGAHWPGQERAPQTLRDVGLVSHLENAGLDVIDYGDLPLVRFRPDKLHRHQQNLAKVVDVANHVADQIELALTNDNFPLVIGGIARSVWA
jgi:arginase